MKKVNCTELSGIALCFWSEGHGQQPFCRGSWLPHFRTWQMAWSRRTEYGEHRVHHTYCIRTSCLYLVLACSPPYLPAMLNITCTHGLKSRGYFNNWAHMDILYTVAMYWHLTPVAEFIVSDSGESQLRHRVCRTGLPGFIGWRAGRYENPMPELTFFQVRDYEFGLCNVIFDIQFTNYNILTLRTYVCILLYVKYLPFWCLKNY